MVDEKKVLTTFCDACRAGVRLTGLLLIIVGLVELIIRREPFKAITGVLAIIGLGYTINHGKSLL